MSSITKYGASSCSPNAWMCKTLGWLTRAIARASEMKRSRKSDQDSSGRISLIATFRSSRSSWARRTTPIAPLPRDPSTRYPSPITVPGSGTGSALAARVGWLDEAAGSVAARAALSSDSALAGLSRSTILGAYAMSGVRARSSGLLDHEAHRFGLRGGRADGRRGLAPCGGGGRRLAGARSPARDDQPARVDGLLDDARQALERDLAIGAGQADAGVDHLQRREVDDGDEALAHEPEDDL